jgi:PAT family beta-lactamase induction signal transducer AmpG
MAVLGFSSGFPAALTGSTLRVWMTKAGIDLHTIGIFSLIGAPYALKFLWSPLMDRFTPPRLGRRRGWIILVQIVLFMGISALGFSSPARTLAAVAGLAFFVAFASASQDIVIDAYRTDLLAEDERGAGAAASVFGWRIGALVSGALALILSDHIGWQNTYLLMAGFMVVGIVGAVFAPEPDTTATPPKSMADAVWGPLADFFSRPSAWMLLLAIVLYKLGDAYAETLTSVFYIDLGFTPSDVGKITKSLGLVSLLAGAAIGGSLMVRLGLFRSLLSFGALQLASLLSFTALALVGKSYAVMAFAVGFENVASGMGTAAFMAFLMSLCNSRYTATQYALLSSLAALGRLAVAPSSGYVAESLGWPNFFLLTSAAAIPGLLLLWHLRTDIMKMTEQARRPS